VADTTTATTRTTAPAAVDGLPAEQVGPRPEDISRCVHCGFCLNFCPTYVALGLETESPRGRIHLIDALSGGRIQPRRVVLEHLDLCLQCRACEATCPSGVRFGPIMEGARAQVVASGRSPLSWRVRSIVLRWTLPHPRRLRVLAVLLRFYQRSGLQSLVRWTRLLRLLPFHLHDLEQLLPPVAGRFFAPVHTGANPDASDGTPRVALLTGCVMPFLYPQTHEATVRVLKRHGYRVVIPEEQVCCGALFVHGGDRQTARRLARRNIDVFLAAEVEAVITNAAGCGSTLKEYGELLADDPEYADKAAHFSSLVKDITEFLVELPFQEGLGRLERRVTYQDSCHLAHAQGITAPPRQLLKAIPGLELVEMENADRCCGSAGIYNVTHREMSSRLLADKMRAVAATAASTVVTANPGCMLQLEAGLRLHGLQGTVAHVVEVVDEAYAAGKSAAPARQGAAAPSAAEREPA
jgi:glycolate oxidase iron-sulfur subunit